MRLPYARALRIVLSRHPDYPGGILHAPRLCPLSCRDCCNVAGSRIRRHDQVGDQRLQMHGMLEASGLVKDVPSVAP